MIDSELGNNSPTPPAGYTSWLDYALEYLDVRSFVAAARLFEGPDLGMTKYSGFKSRLQRYCRKGGEQAICFYASRPHLRIRLRLKCFGLPLCTFYSDDSLKLKGAPFYDCCHNYAPHEF